MPIYETLTILHPDLAEARVKEVLIWMQQLVENGQGKVLQVEEWGMRDLAYRIQKQRRGYYVRLEYEATPAALQELERNFRLSEDVIRFLSIVRKAPSDKRPSVQPRSEALTQTPAETPPEVPAESAAEPSPPALQQAPAQEPATTSADNGQDEPDGHDESPSSATN
jgi:small subunit ribosomal protein S6